MSPAGFVASTPVGRHAAAPRRARCVPRASAQGQGGFAARVFDAARARLHARGVTHERLLELAKSAMGHKAPAVAAVAGIMGRVGVAPESVAAVARVLERVDFEKIVVDGDTARATVVDVERVVLRAVRAEGELVKEIVRRFVKELDTDGDGTISREEVRAAVRRFGTVANAIAAASITAGREAKDGKKDDA